MTRDELIEEFRGVVVKPIVNAMEKLIANDEKMLVDPLIAPDSHREGQVFLGLVRSFLAHLRAWNP